MRQLRYRYFALLAQAAALAFSTSAAAQTSTWTGDFFGVWNQALNWSPNGIPTSATAVNFTGNALGSINISPNGFAQSLSFSNPTGSYTLASSGGVSLSGVTAINVAAGVTGVETINLAANAGGSLLYPSGSNLTITNNSTTLAPTLVIGPNTVIGASGGGNGSVFVDGAGTTQISGGFANVVGGLIKYGTGTMILSGGGNSYHGVTSIGEGTLRLGTGGGIRAGTDVAVGFAGLAAEFNIDQESNTAATAIGTLNLILSGTFRVPSGDRDYYLNKLAMTGGTVDLTGSGQNAGFWLHLVNSGAAITTESSIKTAKWIGSGNSRIQNDTAAPMTITVAAGTTPDGIDLDAGISLSAGSVGSNPNFIKAGAGTMKLTSLKNTANITVSEGKLRVDDLAMGGVGALGSGGITLGVSGTVVYGGPSATTTKNLTLVSGLGASSIQLLTPGVNLNPSYGDRSIE